MRFRTLPLILATLACAAPLAAAELPPSLADLGQDAALTTAYEKMTGGTAMPDWTRDGLATNPTQTARFDGRDWLVMAGCKQHDCAAHQIAVIYDPENGAMHGVLSERGESDSTQVLRWLNIGGGAESIDGRTVLYAALTGSLANHPEAFDYGD